MPLQKGLIIGGDSHLGKVLITRLEKDGWDVWYTTRRSEVSTNKSLFLDLLKPEISEWPKDFDAIWFLAAQTSQALCKEYPEQSHLINVDSPIQIIDAFSKTGTHIIFPSTSLVFSGNKAFPTIHEPTEPVGMYAEQKEEVEKFLLSSSLKHKTVIRLSKILDKDTALLQQWVNSLQQEKIIHPLKDLIFSSISLAKAVEVLAHIALQKAYGLLQISSSEQCSYAEFSYLLARHLQLNSELIEPKTTKDLGLADVHCPLYATLDSSLVENNLGISAPSISETIEDIFGKKYD